MIHIGCSGFYYNHWRKVFYPEDLAKSDWFAFYMKTFDTVEINATFYRFPSKKLVLGWKNKLKKDFVITFKANRLITHIKKLNNVEDLVNSFYQIVSKVGNNLGCILWQLPPSIHFDAEKLNKFCSILDKKYKNVIEFRHKSWWNNETYKILKKYSVIFCSVSGLEMPKDIIKIKDILYIRFHGIRYSTNYSDKELKEISNKIKKLNAKEIFAYFDNDVSGYAVQNSLVLKRFLQD